MRIALSPEAFVAAVLVAALADVALACYRLGL